MISYKESQNKFIYEHIIPDRDICVQPLNNDDANRPDDFKNQLIFHYLIMLLMN